MELLYFPLTLYIFLIGSLRTGKLFYFSAANPKISMGGFACDSKYQIITHIPLSLRPLTIFVLKEDSIQRVMELLVAEKISFPLIVKPDIGEGGFLVLRLTSVDQLEMYHAAHHMNYLIQEFIDYPIE